MSQTGFKLKGIAYKQVLRPVISLVNTVHEQWIHSGEIYYHGKSIHDQVYLILGAFGFGIAFGYRHNDKGSVYLEAPGKIAKQVWFGRIEIYRLVVGD